MNTGVYKITNLINGKFYIGSTSWNFQKRWKTHRNQLRKNKHDNPHLQYSWNKHGELNFKFEIVEDCPKAECFVREQYYIDILKPQYNILQNAGTVRGYKHSAAAKALISAASSGKNHPCYSGEHIFYHPLHGFFESSIVDFAKKFRFRKSLPYKLTQGSLNKSHGWIYVGKIGTPLPKNIIDFYYTKVHNGRPIHLFYHEEGKVFKGTIPDFIKTNRIDKMNRSTIYQLVSHKRKSAWGWHIKT